MPETTNTLLHPVGELHFGTYTPDDVPAALEVAAMLAEQRIADIIALPDNERSFSNTVEAIDEASAEYAQICTITRQLASTLGEEWYDAEKQAVKAATNYSTRLEQNSEIYRAVKYIEQKASELDLTEPQKRALQDEINSFERNGINASPEVKSRLAEIKDRLTELQTLHGQNITNAESKAYLPVDNVNDLEGVDKNYIAAWGDEAAKRGIEGYAITVDTPSYWAVMVNCKSEQIRRGMHKLTRTLVPENDALVAEILALRKEMAELLGYPSFAAYSIEPKMAKTEETVQRFLDTMTELCVPSMHREAAELTAYIEKLTGKPYQLDIIDVDSGIDLFYANLFKKELMGDETINIEEYFPLEQVQEHMFATIEKLYGVTLRPSTQAVYHEDVKAYDVIDEQGNHISTIWCDWLTRPGKDSGAWHLPAYRADRSDGKLDKPHLSFVQANFPRPTEDRPSLLSFDQVGTMWHEFGHTMHAAFSKTQLRSQHSARTKRDFVEAPSQIMENWRWQVEVLTKMAKHYLTGEPLPPECVQNMRKSQNFRAASKMLWSLYWSKVDLYLHSKDYDPQTDGTPNEVGRRIKQQFMPAPVAEYDNGINTFPHMIKNYPAGYYGYPFAEAIEADLFTRFEREGVLNPDTGRSYRDEILAVGNERDPEVSIFKFLGRASTPHALLKRMGIIA